MALCDKKAAAQDTELSGNFNQCDFIIEQGFNSGLLAQNNRYTHVIMNPPYKKITSASDHRKALSSAGIETVNLYTGFVALAINLLAVGGELVTIIPRSFCNGLYYREFRALMLKETAIAHIHLFDSRYTLMARCNGPKTAKKIMPYGFLNSHKNGYGVIRAIL